MGTGSWESVSSNCCSRCLFSEDVYTKGLAFNNIYNVDVNNIICLAYEYVSSTEVKGTVFGGHLKGILWVIYLFYLFICSLPQTCGPYTINFTIFFYNITKFFRWF